MEQEETSVSVIHYCLQNHPNTKWIKAITLLYFMILLVSHVFSVGFSLMATDERIISRLHCILEYLLSLPFHIRAPSNLTYSFHDLFMWFLRWGRWDFYMESQGFLGGSSKPS